MNQHELCPKARDEKNDKPRDGTSLPLEGET